MADYFDKVNNELVLDVLKEIGNIGAGNAATSLSKMINKKIDMEVPKVSVLDFQEVPTMLGGEEVEVCGVFFKLEGDIDGTIMFLVTAANAHTLVELLMPGMQQSDFDEFTLSALSEIGNILSSSYIASMTGLTNLNVRVSPPALTIDMAAAILSVPAIQFGLIGDKVLIIENDFVEEMGSDDVKAYFFMIPDAESYDTLFGSLGITV